MTTLQSDGASGEGVCGVLYDLLSMELANERNI